LLPTLASLLAGATMFGLFTLMPVDGWVMLGFGSVLTLLVFSIFCALICLERAERAALWAAVLKRMPSGINGSA
jgi:hypothetical protein